MEAALVRGGHQVELGVEAAQQGQRAVGRAEVPFELRVEDARDEVLGV